MSLGFCISVCLLTEAYRSLPVISRDFPPTSSFTVSRGLSSYKPYSLPLLGFPHLSSNFFPFWPFKPLNISIPTIKCLPPLISPISYFFLHFPPIGTSFIDYFPFFIFQRLRQRVLLLLPRHRQRMA
ncbi:hypothetical protein VIGAN_10112300, partial [Vigna angularis var. angularis]